MGIQGEIYNVLGLRLPAEVIKKDELYRVNGKTVSTKWDNEDPVDFANGISNEEIDLDNPNLVVRILGHNNAKWLKGSNFEGEALVGYPIANESYIDKATELPPHDAIERLRPRLIKDIRDKLGYDAKEDDLKLYLVFHWMQGM